MKNTQIPATVTIPKSNLSYIQKKTDVWIVYTTDGKRWITDINGVSDDGIFYTLKLARKGV